MDEFELEVESEINNVSKKKRSILVFFSVAITFVVILIDFVIVEYRWRPEVFTFLKVYTWLGHLTAIAALIYLIVHSVRHISEKVSKIISVVVLVICTIVICGFMLGLSLITSRTPEYTLKPEGYDHVYYLYPQSRLFTRRGYGVYIPDSDYTMVYYEGYPAMDYDTSYVWDGHFYIKFDGKNRLFRPEENHLFDFDLSIPQY